MNVAEMLKSIGDQLQTNAIGRNVYGEPVNAGGKTVIPVARVSYGFGGGGGGRRGEAQAFDHGGGGGGGGVSATPVGVVEITPAATRFIPIADWRRTAGLVAIGIGLGLMLGKRRKH